MLMAPPLPKGATTRLLTAEEFLDWLKPGVFADLIGGEIFMHSPANLRHADLISFVDHLLRSFLEEEPQGKLYRECVAVRFSVREMFMPDLAFFTKAQAARLNPAYAPFAPTFVLEALSPATAAVDTGQKFAAYELHGVKEYWILDPDELDHHFYRREGEMLVEFAAAEDLIPSFSIPGFWVKRAWLNPAKLPKVSECLREILTRKHRKR